MACSCGRDHNRPELLNSSTDRPIQTLAEQYAAPSPEAVERHRAAGHGTTGMRDLACVVCVREVDDLAFAEVRAMNDASVVGTGGARPRRR